MTNVELPNAAAKIKQTAEEYGWRVLVGGVAGEKPGVLLGMRRGRGIDAEHIVARWDAGKFAGAWQKWHPVPPEGGVTPRRLSSVALKAALSDDVAR